ncbi:penicillin-binding transpeptidase domain-containing protein [Verrucomicrobia bacterium]|nr:penicillin-binding transpeptidase domain-containing protein [Verrucomicrobiota bacterium]
MEILEKHHPENRRLRVFKALFSVLFLVLIYFLLVRQAFETETFEERERKQGQRRILRPGARGDVLDRNGRLLIGNKAHFSAVLQLEFLKNEIWEEIISLRDLSLSLKEELRNLPDPTFDQLVRHCMSNEFVRNRGIIITGKAAEGGNGTERVRLFFQGERVTVNQTPKGFWHCLLSESGTEEGIQLKVEGAKERLKLSVAGLFTCDLYLHKDGRYRLNEEKTERNGFSISDFLAQEDTEPKFGSSTIKLMDNAGRSKVHTSIEWEARYAVMLKYQDLANRLTGREKTVSFEKLKSHWRRNPIFPLEISGNLSPEEYAKLIDGLDPDSPLQVSSQAVRHYPMGDLASHVLGHVGSGYKADADGLAGKDLGTFEIKGKKGKEGIEVYFDSLLRGKDGVDIWRINPGGLRFDQVERIAAKKGSTVKLSIDSDLQSTAEKALQKMSNRVRNHRILPDADWIKTIEKRTRKELVKANEKALGPDLLLNSFKNAPFPLDGRQASTVAGFKGTVEDAERLLRLLYVRGVLAKPKPEADEYVLAPPPPPPGAAVLIHLKSREVLVLASKPNYNLQDFSPSLSQSAFDRIQRREAWLPRALNFGYAPASPFKLITAMSGFRSGVIDPEEKLLCEGIHKGMICHVHPGTHGELTFREAVARSCNVYFFRIAERIGHANLIAEARRLNMHTSPSVELPSPPGSPIVPDPDWKKKALGVGWTLEDTFNISIGQGGLRQSPLQMACMIAKLASNNLSFQPSILYQDKKRPDVSTPLGITEENRLAIIDGMHLATTDGTAHRGKIEGIDVAGKTGTGQWRNHNMKLNLAWFVGFAPLDNPEVAIAVLIEGIIPQDKIQGGLTATPVARDILKAYFERPGNRLARSE